MPSIKDLKKRIGTVKNTQQTTKAMKMVSAAKLRRSQDAILSQRPYAQQIGRLMKALAARADLADLSQLIHPRELSGEKKKLHLVLVTSDRGLCGGFNASVIKAAQRWLKTNQNQYAEVQMSFIGRKSHDFFKTKGVKIKSYQEFGSKVAFARARATAEQIIKDYLAGEFDEVIFVYNEFKNAVLQTLRFETFLPLSSGIKDVEGDSGLSLDSYLIKPNAKELFEALLSKHFSTQVFRILLESQAGEHGARMSAMENATKNAGDMIRRLTLQFNKQRQAAITKELLEIIAGSESQKETQ